MKNHNNIQKRLIALTCSKITFQDSVIDDSIILICFLFCSRLNFIHECERLTRGFEENVQSGPVKKLIKDIKKIVKVPDWHKSPMWTVIIVLYFLFVNVNYILISLYIAPHFKILNKCYEQ